MTQDETIQQAGFRLWRNESLRAASRRRTFEQWMDESEQTREHWRTAAGAALGPLLEEVERYRAALQEVVACFDAAYCEGLNERLSDEEHREVGSLFDLIQRRVLFAEAAAKGALYPKTEPKG